MTIPTSTTLKSIMLLLGPTNSTVNTTNDNNVNDNVHNTVINKKDIWAIIVRLLLWIFGCCYDVGIVIA